MALVGTLHVASDKSITHRAIIMASLSSGETIIENPLLGEDCLSTLHIFESLGVQTKIEENRIIINSIGLSKFTKPNKVLQANNSGTTARLLMGVLASLPFDVILAGDASLSKRPMKRVSEPLAQMNACIDLTNESTLPAVIKGQNLQSITYKLPVASAQVKSAIMLAAICANGTTIIEEPVKSRNHTEKMFETFKLQCEVTNNNITIKGSQQPQTPGKIVVCGDISSAAFFMVGAALVKESHVTLKNVGLNETRTGIIDVMKAMNANIVIEDERFEGGEKVGTIIVSYSPNLIATTIEGDLIPRLIDEIPIIALLCAHAKGTTIIKDAQELKVKETNRLDKTFELLQQIGLNLEATLDGMIIYGQPKVTLKSCEVNSYGDHRLAMMLYIASLLIKEGLEIEDLQSMNISYQNFIQDILALTKE